MMHKIRIVRAFTHVQVSFKRSANKLLIGEYSILARWTQVEFIFVKVEGSSGFLEVYTLVVVEE